MNVIATTPQRAEDALVGIARAVPPEMPIGRPLVALAEGDGGVQILTEYGEDEPATWWLEPTGTAARLLPLGNDRVEVTRWRDGVEIMRTIERPE